MNMKKMLFLSRIFICISWKINKFAHIEKIVIIILCVPFSAFLLVSFCDLWQLLYTLPQVLLELEPLVSCRYCASQVFGFALFISLTLMDVLFRYFTIPVVEFFLLWLEILWTILFRIVAVSA